MEEKITEKITATAAETFRNLNRLRVLVESVRSLASEVNPGDAPAAPAEELPGMITEGIVSRIDALEQEVAAATETAAAAQVVADDAKTKAESAQTTATTAKTTATTAKSTATTANTMANSAKTTADKALALTQDANAGAMMAEDAYWNTLRILDRLDGVTSVVRGRLAPGTTEATYKFDGSAAKILPLEVDETTGVFSATVPSPPKSCFQMFKDNKKLTRVETMPDLSQCTSLYMTFCGCEALKRVNTRGWDTSACTSMVYFLQACKALGEVDVSGLDTSKVTDMGGAFNSMVALRRLDLSAWDVSACKAFEHMFYGDTALEELDVSTWNLASATSIKGIFHNCNKLTSLDVSRWSTPSLTNASYAFYMMASLEELDLTGWDVSKVTNFRGMISECYALHTLHLGVFDMGSADVDEESGTRQMFWASSKLANVTGEVRNLARGLDLRHCPLTNESAMVFINGLADVTTAQTVTFSAATYATLTEGQIAIATAKGWTVAQAE